MTEAKVLQIEGLTARHFFDAINTLQTEIQALKNQPQPTPAPGYLTRSEVAELLKISHVTLHDWVNKGLLKAWRLGNRVYFKQAEIEHSLLEIPQKRGHGKA